MTATDTDIATMVLATAARAGQPMTAPRRCAPTDALDTDLVSTTPASATVFGPLLIALHKGVRTTARVTDIAATVPACVDAVSQESIARFLRAPMNALDTELARTEDVNARTRGQILIAL